PTHPNHNIQNVEHIHIIEWIYGDFIVGHESNGYDYWAQIFEVTATGIHYRFGPGWGSNLPLIVTFQYTKTTDQPGSGTWTPEGQLAHHYFTSEKIVGTWIDGSTTVYERTINGGITFSANDTWYDTGLTGINKVVSFECSLLRDGELVGSAFNTGHINYTVRSNALKIKSYNLLIYDNFTLDHITIRYTKTS
ncbi:MAG: hypothetical protein J6I58_01570, partial [Eubacterium sp.]|nr:hypothetical protein [Eubacterium sp.]